MLAGRRNDDYTVAITGATGKTGRNVVSTLGRGWRAGSVPPTGRRRAVDPLSIGTINAPGPWRSRVATRRTSSRSITPALRKGRPTSSATRPSVSGSSCSPLARRGARPEISALHVRSSALRPSRSRRGAAADLVPRPSRPDHSFDDRQRRLRLPAGTGRTLHRHPRHRRRRCRDDDSRRPVRHPRTHRPGSDRPCPGRRRPPAPPWATPSATTMSRSTRSSLT